MTSVTALDVRRLFNVTQETRFRFNGWFRTRDEVVARVMEHVCRVVFALPAAEIEAAARSAPGPGPVPEVREIAQWRPRFPFTVVAHHVVEALGRLPDWPEFRAFCEADDVARAMLWAPALEVVNSAAADPRAARAALRARVIADYLGFLRDLHVLAVLRGHGVEVLTHPLADVVFQVDAWVERLVLNPRGGPQRSEALLVHAMPPYFFFDLAVGAPFDRVPLDRAARGLREVLYPGAGS
ncbi:hypothetical protein [Actinosynnema sp. NPDC020468]|uniref:hypothetical protein n=1 Tax=Actinosynnema sp. NPDC020468 TaxID=3154488 RepID=UPI0033E38015